MMSNQQPVINMLWVLVNSKICGLKIKCYRKRIEYKCTMLGFWWYLIFWTHCYILLYFWQKTLIAFNVSLFVWWTGVKQEKYVMIVPFNLLIFKCTLVVMACEAYCCICLFCQYCSQYTEHKLQVHTTNTLAENIRTKFNIY